MAAFTERFNKIMVARMQSFSERFLKKTKDGTLRWKYSGWAMEAFPISLKYSDAR